MTWDIEAERLKARRTFKPMPIIECKECGVIVERTELTKWAIDARLCQPCYYEKRERFRSQAEYPDIGIHRKVYSRCCEDCGHCVLIVAGKCTLTRT